MHEAVGSRALLPPLLDEAPFPGRVHSHRHVRGGVDCGDGGCVGLQLPTHSGLLG